MNHALRRVSLACLAMFLLLLVNANYVQGFEAGKLADDPGNGRTFALQYQYQRGSIITSDNKTIAESKHIGGVYSYQRYYPDRADVRAGDRLRHPVPQDGHRGGGEQAAGRHRPAARPCATSSTWSPASPRRGRRSSSPSTPPPSRPPTRRSRPPGCPAPPSPSTRRPAPSWRWPPTRRSTPTSYATLNGNALNKADEKYLNSNAAAAAQPGDQRDLPAGFHVQDRDQLHGLLHRQVHPAEPLLRADRPQAAAVPPHQLINYDNLPCDDGSNPTGNGTVPLIYAFAVSCNTVFGGLGSTSAAAALRQQANKFGMNRPLRIPLPVSPSNYPPVSNPDVHRLLGDRPVQRHGDAAAGGDVRGGDRQQGHADAAVPGAEGDRPEPDQRW